MNLIYRFRIVTVCIYVYCVCGSYGNNETSFIYAKLYENKFEDIPRHHHKA